MWPIENHVVLVLGAALLVVGVVITLAGCAGSLRVQGQDVLGVTVEREPKPSGLSSSSPLPSHLSVAHQ